MGTGEFYRAFWIIGICGGFTTFSTFGMDLYGLLQKGSWLMGSVYLLANFLGHCSLFGWATNVPSLHFNKFRLIALDD